MGVRLKVLRGVKSCKDGHLVANETGFKFNAVGMTLLIAGNIYLYEKERPFLTELMKSTLLLLLLPKGRHHVTFN